MNRQKKEKIVKKKNIVYPGIHEVGDGPQHGEDEDNECQDTRPSEAKQTFVF